MGYEPSREALIVSKRNALTTWPLVESRQMCDYIDGYWGSGELDRELAQFIYVVEIKRFDPCKSSISASCMQITITGSSTPVRLALGPFLRVPKMAVLGIFLTP